MSQAKVKKVNPRLMVVGVAFVGLHVPLVALAFFFLAMPEASVAQIMTVCFFATLAAALPTLMLIWRQFTIVTSR